MTSAGVASVVSPSEQYVSQDEVSRVDYKLKLIKVGSDTRWGVHDGRKVVGKLFETYGQAAAERLRIEAREAGPSAKSATE